MALQIKPARRARAFARVGLVGPAGSGKTHGGLLIAAGLVSDPSFATTRRPTAPPWWEVDPNDPLAPKTPAYILLGDTEAGSGSMEEGKPNIPQYDTVQIEPPFKPEVYIEFLQLAQARGYEVAVIDSLSHAWVGQGGLLDTHGKLTDRGQNSFTAWRTVTPKHNALIEAILQSRLHVVATMRAKTEYVLSENDKGKQVPKKVGMAPVQREGMDYEFTLVFDVDQDTHTVKASKDRTSLFDRADPFRVTRETGVKLHDWLKSGVEVARTPDDPSKATTSATTSPSSSPKTSSSPSAPAATSPKPDSAEQSSKPSGASGGGKPAKKNEADQPTPSKQPSLPNGNDSSATSASEPTASPSSEGPEPPPPPSEDLAPPANGDASASTTTTTTTSDDDDELLPAIERNSMIARAKQAGLATAQAFIDTFGTRPSQVTRGRAREILKQIEKMLDDKTPS